MLARSQTPASKAATETCLQQKSVARSFVDGLLDLGNVSHSKVVTDDLALLADLARKLAPAE